MHFFLILIPLALALFLPCLIRRSQLAGLRAAARTGHRLGIE